jgi:hypothetical protein
MFALALPRPGKISHVFMYPWARKQLRLCDDDALDIATNYLMLPVQAVLFKEAQATAAKATITAWQDGIKHRIKLRQSRTKCPCARKPINRQLNRQLFGPYSGCVTCSVK